MNRDTVRAGCRSARARRSGRCRRNDRRAGARERRRSGATGRGARDRRRDAAAHPAGLCVSRGRRACSRTSTNPRARCSRSSPPSRVETRCSPPIAQRSSTGTAFSRTATRCGYRGERDSLSRRSDLGRRAGGRPRRPRTGRSRRRRSCRSARRRASRASTPTRSRGPARRMLIMNTYHLWLRPGPEVVAEHGGLHGFSRIALPIATDSGGFQAFSLSPSACASVKTASNSRRTSTARASCSRPRRRCACRACLGSDIAMQLDVCPPAGAPRGDVVARRRADHALGRALPRREKAESGGVRHRAGRNRRRASLRARRDARAAAARRPRARRLQRRRAERRDAPDARRSRSGARPGAPALRDGRRNARRSRARDRRGRRSLRLRASDAKRAKRHGLRRERPRGRQEQRAQELKRAARGRLPLHCLQEGLQPRLPAPSLSLARDARRKAHDRAQSHLLRKARRRRAPRSASRRIFRLGGSSAGGTRARHPSRTNRLAEWRPWLTTALLGDTRQNDREEAARQNPASAASPESRAAGPRARREEGWTAGVAPDRRRHHQRRFGAESAERAARHSRHRSRSNLPEARDARPLAARDRGAASDLAGSDARRPVVRRDGEPSRA